MVGQQRWQTPRSKLLTATQRTKLSRRARWNGGECTETLHVNEANRQNYHCNYRLAVKQTADTRRPRNGQSQQVPHCKTPEYAAGGNACKPMAHAVTGHITTDRKYASPTCGLRALVGAEPFRGHQLHARRRTEHNSQPEPTIHTRARHSANRPVGSISRTGLPTSSRSVQHGPERARTAGPR